MTNPDNKITKKLILISFLMMYGIGILFGWISGLSSPYVYFWPFGAAIGYAVVQIVQYKRQEKDGCCFQ